MSLLQEGQPWNMRIRLVGSRFSVLGWIKPGTENRKLVNW